jgi:integrase
MKQTLTEQFVKNIRIPGRYTDASLSGLHINVKKNGGKYWVYRYAFAGTRHDIALGTYPDISIKQARARAVCAKGDLVMGKKPVTVWKIPTIKEETKIENTFRNYASKCIKAKQAEWKNKKHAAQWGYTIETFANPVIGRKELAEITTEDILKILTPIWQTKTETANRLRGRIEWVLASATTRGLRQGQNPATWRGHLETILPRPTKINKVRHHPALDYKKVPAFMRALSEVEGISALALEFLILNANRTSEVTSALRSEIYGDVWIIPESRMKAGVEHRIPLTKRAIEIIEVAISQDPSSKYIFSKNGKPLSSMAMAMTLRRLDSDSTVHGFRSSFRDWVSEETSHSPEVAEMALAHTIRNHVEKAYRRGNLFERRKILMNDWAHYCSSTNTNNVLNFVRAA